MLSYTSSFCLHWRLQYSMGNGTSTSMQWYEPSVPNDITYPGANGDACQGIERSCHEVEKRTATA